MRDPLKDLLRLLEQEEERDAALGDRVARAEHAQGSFEQRHFPKALAAQLRLDEHNARERNA